jgi:hypothetical protein
VSARKTTAINQARAITMLLSGSKINEVASELGLSEKTIDSWLRSDDFRSELTSNAQKIIDATVANLIALNSKCVDVLTDILENSSDRNRLHAVKLIFETNGKWLDNDILKRIEKLETYLESAND